MTVRANLFTPEVLLSAPRRSAGVPNASGTSILYTTSTYSFDSHSKTTELRCLDVETKESTLLTAEPGISEPVWLPDREDSVFACLKAGDKGSTHVVISSAAQGSDWKHVSYTAGTIEAPAANLKIVSLSGDDCERYAVVVSAQVYPDGSVYNPETAPKTHSTGKLYDSLFVRHWDEYKGAQKNALLYGVLKINKDGRFEMSELRNALKGTGLESPIPPFGGTDSFDVSRGGIIFVSKDPAFNPALNTKSNAYFIALSSFLEEEPAKPFQYKIPGFEGASSAPAFHPDGTTAAFLSMKRPGYEADKNQIIVIPDVNNDYTVRCLGGEMDECTWDRSHQNIFWSRDGKELYFSAEDNGYGRLYTLPWPANSDAVPRALTKHGYVSDIKPLARNGHVFTSSSSLIDNSIFSIINTSQAAGESEATSPIWTHSATKSGSSLGLNSSQVSSFRAPASNPSINSTIHAWVLKPSTFDPAKKYPLAFLIHGGPQGSWADSWSTRWNPAIFAEAGYIVVSPNPTGSTGYGQAFTDAIRKNWGGAPYQDLVNCMDYIETHMPEVDISNAVALGASYGGYMINWINGHDLGRRFRALVCHDGIFSLTGLLATEELYFPFHDLGGTPWHRVSPASNDNPAQTTAHPFDATSLSAWRENDPSLFLDKWSTPQLVIHSSKDYRLPISEGLAAFNVLQTRGVRSQFLTFPDENHWVLKPENGLLWHKVVLDWCDEAVGKERRYSKENEVDFFGGWREGDGEVVEMIGMGKPET